MTFYCAIMTFVWFVIRSHFVAGGGKNTVKGTAEANYSRFEF